MSAVSKTGSNSILKQETLKVSALASLNYESLPGKLAVITNWHNTYGDSDFEPLDVMKHLTSAHLKKKLGA